MIRFKYNMKPDLQQLVYNTIADYTSDFLYGMMEEGTTGNILKHSSLYLICPEDYHDGQQFNHDPVAVVAKTADEAMLIYSDEFNKLGYLIAEIEGRCDNIKVEPV